MDDLLKLGLILLPVGYLLLYTGVKIELSCDAAKLMSVAGVFGALTGGVILLFFGVEKLFPEAQSFSVLIQFFFLVAVLVGAAAPIWFFLKRMRLETA